MASFEGGESKLVDSEGRARIILSVDNDDSHLFFCDCESRTRIHVGLQGDSPTIALQSRTAMMGI